MMERELLALCEAAMKAALAAAMDGVSSNGPEVSRCIDSLKRLKDFPVTGDVLVLTTADKRLRHLRQHNKEKIRSMAKWLLEIWSKKIKEYISREGKNSVIMSSMKTLRYESIMDHQCSTRNNRKKGSDGVFAVKNCMGISRNNGNDIGITFPSTKTHQDKSTNSSRVKRKCDGDNVFPEKKCRIDSGKLEAAEEKKGFKFVIKIKPLKDPYKDSKEDQKVSLKCCDASRNKIREVLLEALQRVGGEVDEERKEKVRACDPVAVAVSVESEMFKKMGPYNGAKKLKYRSIMFNMKDTKNPDLRRKILLGEVKPERLISMSAEEMASHERQRENDKIKEKAALLDQIKKSMDGEISEEKSDYDEAKWLESLW